MRKPFFKNAHQTWYIHDAGRMVRPGPDKAEAHRKYRELMASDAPSSSSDSVAGLLNAPSSPGRGRKASQALIHKRLLIGDLVAT